MSMIVPDAADIAELVRANPWFVEAIWPSDGPGPDPQIPNDVFAAALKKMCVEVTVFEDDGHRPAPRRSQQVKREAVRRVLARLYPDGIPDQATLPNKMLVAAVAPDLPFLISPDTVLRAAGRK